MRQNNIAAIVGATTTATSSPIDTEYAFYASAQAVVTGTLVGTVKFQACNDNTSNQQGNSTINWTDITGESVTISAAGTALIPKFDTCYQYIRIVFTATGGAGTISVNVVTKGA